MNFYYSQVFLLVYIVAIWVFYLLLCRKEERIFEKSVSAEYGKTRLTSILYALMGIGYILWTLLIFIYFFNYRSVNWFYKITILDNDFVKIFSIVIMCFGFLLNILFTVSHGKSVKATLAKGEPTKLVTNGIFRYIRNPAYLSVDLGIFGTFLIIPGILTFAFSLSTIIALYLLSLEEEKLLLRMYGNDYEKYKNRAGRFFPKIKSR